MTAAIVIEEEIHANTRRTRITYRGRVDGRPAAIKCYKAPLYGLIHWLRAHLKAQRIRRSPLPFPEVLYSGWLSGQRCFGVGFIYLEGSVSVSRLVEKRSEESFKVIDQLVDLLVTCHKVGVEQSDANLTNFLRLQTGGMAVVDEDGVKLHRAPLPERIALFNLAAAVSRLHWRTQDDVRHIWGYYSTRAALGSGDGFRRFNEFLSFWDRRLEAKNERKQRLRAKRG